MRQAKRKGFYVLVVKWHHHTNVLFIGVVSYLIERASGLAKRTIERTKVTMDLAQKTIGGTTLYSQ